MQKDKFQNLHYSHDAKMSETKKLTKKEKHSLALQLFSQGKTVEEVMKEIGIARNTALKYFSEFQNLHHAQTYQIPSSQDAHHEHHTQIILIFVILGVLVVISVFQYSIILNNLILLAFADGILLLGMFAIVKYAVSGIEDAIDNAIHDIIGRNVSEIVRNVGNLQNLNLDNIDPKYVTLAQVVMPYLRDYLPREARNPLVIAGLIQQFFGGKKEEKKEEEKPKTTEDIIKSLRPGEIRPLS
jgi:hypothetical protein